MTVDDDRLTRVRDAILLWLFRSKHDKGNPSPRLDRADIEATVEWQGDPIREQELADATSYLLAKGWISGNESWGGGVGRPRLTPEGEDLVQSRQSTRPTPPRDGGSFTFGDINAANVTIGHGNTVNQNNTTNDIRFGPALQIADLLDKIASGPDVPAAAVTAAQNTAAEIRDEVAKPGAIKEVVKALVFKASTTIAGQLGPVLGHELTQLGLEAWHAL